MEIPAKSRHKCSFCSYTCTQLGHLESHMRTHTREKPYICDKCNRVFSTQAHLNTHIKNLHNPRPPRVHTETFKCSFCPYEEHSKLNYERHVLNHTGERRFPCPQSSCKYGAKTFQELQQHNVHNHNNERKFKCPFLNCGYRGKSKRMVRSHYASHNNDRAFACDFEGCNYRTKRMTTLKGHKLGVHHGGYKHKPFACSQCKYSTTSMSQLKSHGFTHREEKPFICDFTGCSYAAKIKTSLISHIEHRHTEKTFKCDFARCSFVGPSERFLAAHKKNVHSEKIHKCPCCHYRAAFLFKLRNHMERHNNSHRILSCQNKSCTKHGKDHESLKHNKRYDEANPGFPGDDCYDPASPRSAVQRHMPPQDPTGRPFHCPLCPKQFFKEAVLWAHLRMHTIEKPFKCPLCSYGSARKDTLITHVRGAHSDIFPEFHYDRKSTCNHCHMNFGCAAGIAMHTIKVKTAVVVLTRLQIKLDS